ncbi:C39 family peptidase [Patescibacteria group bacterium]
MKTRIISVILVVAAAGIMYGVSQIIDRGSEPLVNEVEIENSVEATNESIAAVKAEVEDDVGVEDVDKAGEVTQEVLIPEEHYLDIPFTPQAPHAEWEMPYQEACEEAAIMMAARYLQGRVIEDEDDADRAILQLVDYGESIGYPIDTTAAETADTLTRFYDLETEVIYSFSWDDVKSEVAQGHPVILPAAGRLLENPNYTEPGPLYHMLVVKGFSPEHVITNDPGTKNGLDYKYEYDLLFNAVHDWNGGDVENGAKAMIVVREAS